MADIKSVGSFEEVILLAILRLKADAYGAQIRKTVENATGRSVSMSTQHWIDWRESDLSGLGKVRQQQSAVVERSATSESKVKACRRFTKLRKPDES